MTTPTALIKLIPASTNSYEFNRALSVHHQPLLWIRASRSEPAPCLLSHQLNPNQSWIKVGIPLGVLAIQHPLQIGWIRGWFQVDHIDVVDHISRLIMLKDLEDDSENPARINGIKKKFFVWIAQPSDLITKESKRKKEIGKRSGWVNKRILENPYKLNWSASKRRRPTFTSPLRSERWGEDLDQKWIQRIQRDSTEMIERIPYWNHEPAWLPIQ